MAVNSIQDRTAEFRSVLNQVQKRQNTSKVGSQRRNLLTDSQKAIANGDAPAARRSDFARRAADIGRGIAGTMAKLEKLAVLAKRKTLFDDKPTEINQLTFIIKQGEFDPFLMSGVAPVPKSPEFSTRRSSALLTSRPYRPIVSEPTNLGSPDHVQTATS